MRLESALYSAREGLDSHGKAISVIGDNIANSNTIAFKASRTEFSDLMSGGINGGANESENPALPSTGSGVAIQRVRQMQEGGVVEFTGRDLDVAIEGNGFMLLGEADAPMFSKAGNLEIDEEGFLVNSAGFNVLGLSPDSTELSAINLVDIELSGEPTTGFGLKGNLSSLSPVTEVADNPGTYKELGKDVSYVSSVGVYDSLGAQQDVGIYYFKTDQNQWTVQAYVDSGQLGQEAGAPVKIGEAALNFDENGKLAAGGADALTLSTAFEGAEASNISVDISQLEQFATDPNIRISNLDGQSAGSISGYEIMTDGQIMANLDSGSRILAATMQFGTVQNVDGLERGGHGLFVETATSGERVIGSPDSNGLGKALGYSLERSTVDISTEFVNLTLYQRGYQASSQIMSTTNDMLRDTINLMR